MSESFSLKSTKIGTGNNLFPTDEFYVSVDLNSVAPSTALKQSALSQLTNKNKTVEYKVTEGFDIVSILSTSELDENGIPMAKVRVNDAKSGNFAITAYICDKYENVAKIKTDAEYSALTEEERQRYNAETYGGTIFDADSNEIVFEGFMISSSIQLKSEALEVESISAISNIDDCKLFKTYRRFEFKNKSKKYSWFTLHK